MANTVKIQIDLEGEEALRSVNALKKGLKGLGDDGTKGVKKLDSAIGSFIGNLGAIAAVKGFQFLKDQINESFNTFVAYEKGLINVAKTANLTNDEVEELAKGVLKLSEEIPATTEELLSIATAAGQLGVKGTKNLTKFTDTIAKLGRVSNLEGEEAATVLTRILNVTRENIDTIDVFGSVIVSLGNNFAATEQEIALVANEVARATSQFGVSASEAAALGATLRSVGIRAEEAGGVLSKAFIKIDQSIRAGGKSLEKLSELTGLTGSEIKKQFGKDAIGFFRNFVAGLDQVQKSGGDVTATLNQFDIKGIRVSKVLPVLAANTSEFDRALGLMNKELTDATALNEEFEKSLTSTDSATKLLGNSLERARIRIGEKLAGAFEKVAPFLTDFVDKIGKSDIELFAESTEDVNKLNKEISIYKQQLASLADSPLPAFLQIDPEETAQKIEVLKNRVRELNEESASDALRNLKAELKGLEEEAKNADPLLLSIYGDPKQIEERKKVILEQIANIEKQAVMQGKEIIEQGENDKTEKIIEKTIERKTLLDELRAVEAAEEAQRREQEQIEKELASQQEFEFLTENLGKKATLEELARIKGIESEKKRNAELKKLREKAVKEEKVSLLDLRKFEDMTNSQKVEAQKATLNTIASLSSSNSGTLFQIGKAASLATAGINVAEGVTKALGAFPPPFNFAAAAAVGAAGAIQLANIAGAKKPSSGRFAEGGIVGGNSLSGDNLTANVNSREMILNQRQQKNLFDGINKGAVGGSGPVININNPMFLSDDSVDNVIDQINDRVEFGNKTLKASEVAA